MVALIQAARVADFPAEIVLVISNRADALGLGKAKASGIPALVVESKPFGKDRASFEAVLRSTLDQHRVELICLGGFMRLFTAEFAKCWYGRMLNIHPSLLPSFPGLDPHGQALRAGVKISGATVHFVIPETDAGPVVMQGAVSVSDRDTVETLSERILEVEHRIYPEALRLLASGRIRIEGEICKIDEAVGSDNFLISPTVTSAQAADSF
jgi:phosphoribosylglycinamide formyltransferase-1